MDGDLMADDERQDEIEAVARELVAWIRDGFPLTAAKFQARLDRVRDARGDYEADVVYALRRAGSIEAAVKEAIATYTPRDRPWREWVQRVAKRTADRVRDARRDDEAAQSGATLWVKKCPVDWCGVRWIEGHHCPRGHKDEPVVERFLSAARPPQDEAHEAGDLAGDLRDAVLDHGCGVTGRPHRYYTLVAIIEVLHRYGISPCARDARHDDEYTCPNCGEHFAYGPNVPGFPTIYSHDCDWSARSPQGEDHEAGIDRAKLTRWLARRLKVDEFASAYLADDLIAWLARNAPSPSRDGSVAVEGVERLKAELQALVDWFNDAPFLRAERLLYDLSRVPASTGDRAQKEDQ